MNNKEELKKIVEFVCNTYINVLLNGIEEYKEDFPYTIAVANFMKELKEKGITIDFRNVFNDKVIDNIYIETKRFLKR